MQKIEVKNFRQISYACIDLRDLIFIIGEQACGKSTVVKLIYFCKSLKQDFVDILSHGDVHNAKEAQDRLIKTIQDKFAVYFGYTSSLASDFSVKFSFSDEEDDYIHLFKAKSLQVKFSDNMWQNIYLQSQAYLSRVKKHNIQSYPSFQLQEKANGTLNAYLIDIAAEVFHDRRSALFFPAGRNITVSYPEQFQLLFFGSMNVPMNAKTAERNTVDMKLMKEFFSYSKFLVDYFSDQRHNINPSSPFLSAVADRINLILHGKYKNSSGNERIIYDKDGHVPLNIASSGQQESIRIIQDLVYLLNEKESACRIIEEPETHLFPAAQAALIQLMAMIANYTGSQFIVTTHSPFVMAAFNNLLYYRKVVTSNESVKASVDEHFHVVDVKYYGVSPESFQAYALSTSSDSYCKSIFDSETQMIGENYIDEASEVLYGDFDYLYSRI